MKKEVEICDECSKKVAEKKCEICEKDLCSECADQIDFMVESQEIMGFMVCSSCAESIDNGQSLSKQFDDAARKDFIQKMKNAIMLDNLSGKKKKSEVPRIRNLYAGSGIYSGPPYRISNRQYRRMTRQALGKKIKPESDSMISKLSKMFK